MAAVSYARWSQIQSDLVDRRGFPYTTNIGNGRIKGLETTADWVPMTGLKFGGSLFLNRSSLYDPVLALARQKGDQLADIPRFSGNTRLSYQWGDPETSQWSGWAAASHVGRSYVGFGSMLNIAQGGYSVMSAGAGWRHGNLNVMLDLDNLTNNRANRFSLGNPFAVADRNQQTPLRPRSLKLTVAKGF